MNLPESVKKYIYYEEKNPDLFVLHGDCLEILPLLPKVDLVVTDPPYGIFKDTESSGIMFGKETIYSVDKTATEWDKRPSLEAITLAKNKADFWIIWGANYFADYLGASKGTLVWNKKTGDNTYADGELAFTNAVGTMRIFNHQWCGAFKDSERGMRAVHPTQKPVQLMQWCIQKVKDAQIILDPFLGSGTTLVACKELNRNGIGIEISEKYCELSKKRLRATTKSLF